MSTHLNDDAQAQDRLWKEIDKARYGMLAPVGSVPPQHFQPMTAFAEPEAGLIWFFTRKTTDLARAVAKTGEGAQAMYVVQAKDQGFQACIGGLLELRDDRDRMDRFWNPVVAAWYPEGKDDPDLTLLRFDARDAQIWVSDTNPVKFAWSIAKANTTHTLPDVGERAKIDLDAGRPAS